MAQTFKVTFKGKDTKGSSTRWKDSVEGLDYKHGVTHAYNAATGGSAGERSWSPAVITFDAADPAIIGLLKHAVARENSLVDEVDVEWFRTSKEGKEETYLKVKMTSVLVHKVDFFTPVDGKTVGQEHAGDRLQVRVHLIFGQIQYEAIGGKAMDDGWAKRG